MKKFFAMAVLCLVALAACSPEEKVPEVTGTLSVTSPQQMEFSFVGGEGEITYAILEGEEGAQPTASCAQEWVSNLTVAETITFDVARNNAEESRVATIYVKYGTQEVMVVLTQAETYPQAHFQFEAKALNGEYERESKQGGYNYFIILSEKGTTGWYDLYVDTYFRIDLFSDVAPDPENLTLPVGVYYFDEYSMEGHGTFAQAMSYRLQCTEDGGYSESQFTDGVIIVTEEGIEAFFTLTNQEIYHVTYEGSLELGYIPIPAPDHYSSLTADYTFEHKGGNAWVFFYGDYEGNGLGNWTITTMETHTPMNGDYFKIDVYVDSLEFNTDNVYGEYTAVATVAELKAGNYLGGLFGSWYYLVEDDYLIQGSGAPLMEGTVKFEKNGTGCLLTVDCVDDLGYKIQGTFDCSTMEFFDRTAE